MLRALAIVTLPVVVLGTTPTPTTSAPTFTGQDTNTYWQGSCWMGYDGVCNGIVNNGKTKRPIFIYQNANKTHMEQLAITNILTAHDQSAILSTDSCKILTDSFVCAAIYFGCDSTTFTEPVPMLPCQQFCLDTWAACRTAYDDYLALTIGRDNYKNSILPNCGPNATFSLDSLPAGTTSVLPADRFGYRMYPNYPIWPMGYKGQLQFPPDVATYTTKDGVSKNVTCQVPGVISAVINTNYVGTQAPIGNGNIAMVQGMVIGVLLFVVGVAF